MEIVSNKNEMIFKTDFNGVPRYSVGLSRKNKDGSYTRGYMIINFKNGVELENKTQIRIKSAWLDFYKDKDDKTVPYIFVNEFEKVKKDPFKEFGDNIKTDFDTGEQIQITDEDLPF